MKEIILTMVFHSIYYFWRIGFENGAISF